MTAVPMRPPTNQLDRVGRGGHEGGRRTKDRPFGELASCRPRPLPRPHGVLHCDSAVLTESLQTCRGSRRPLLARVSLACGCLRVRPGGDGRRGGQPGGPSPPAAAPQMRRAGSTCADSARPDAHSGAHDEEETEEDRCTAPEEDPRSPAPAGRHRGKSSAGEKAMATTEHRPSPALRMLVEASGGRR